VVPSFQERETGDGRLETWVSRLSASGLKLTQRVFEARRERSVSVEGRRSCQIVGCASLENLDLCFACSDCGIESPRPTVE
jgi:hypothetical protein